MQAKLTSVVTAYGSSENSSERLTPLRRHVLGLLEARGGKASAYELLADLTIENKAAAPATIYRVLHYLIQSGAVRRIATTNTFIISDLASAAHEVVMVCTNCGAISVVDDETLRQTLMSAALKARYLVAGQETEIKGICEVCADAGMYTNNKFEIKRK